MSVIVPPHPSTPLSRIDLEKLYPPFLEKVRVMLAALESSGASYFAVSGFRSYPEQEVLYNHGRKTPGAIVTQAHAGESPHNFGLAVDFTRDGYLDRAGLQPDFRPERYSELGLAAATHGLEWGGKWRWPDRPHIQWPGFVTSWQLEPLRQAYEKAGLAAVWTYLDTYP